MESHFKIGLICVSALFCLLQCISCEETLDGSATLKWTCVCSAGPLGALDYSPAFNCSTLCDCMPGAGPDGGWNCACVSGATPQDLDNNHHINCFTACNCTSGSPGTPTASKKHVSKKIIVVILLLCVVLTTITFLASIAYYFYCKDRHCGKQPKNSSDKESSWNSAANLISHRSVSFAECQVKSKSPFNPIPGFIRRLSFIFGSEMGSLPGVISQFSYFELEQATNKFSNANLIGLGGSSNVYRGQLRDGRVVAVKKLKTFGGPEAESSFLTEIELISRLNHCHVVPLLGYCSEPQGKQSERLLVFDYMSNGNLRECLNATQGKETMNWATRVCIALGVAKGLEYLHEAAAPRILHRDIKSTNILLDDRYRAKITDLGMAKCLLTDDPTSCSNSPARMLGTFGYFAPEYAIVGKASLKSDVFSFGVVILELITGRQPIQKSSDKGDESLVIWAMARLRDSKLVISELPDPLLKGNFPEEEMQIMGHLARECLQWDPDSRPSMSEVVQILSVITPDKSKRRNFPARLFMSSSSHSIRSNSDIERSEGLAERLDPNRAASVRGNARCSLPLAVDRNLCCEDHQRNTETVLSAEYMQRLILLTSNVKSWRTSDDEIEDLTEPHFESFVQANIRSL